MKYTISTHMGTKVCLGHNFRDEFTSKEKHIDPNGKHEIWVQNAKTLKEAYENLFGEALKEYNQKQLEKGRKNRVVKSYLEKIKKEQKKPIYEMVVTVGSCKDKEPLSENKIHDILEKYLNRFMHFNPNMYIVAACYHADEAHPHLHISMIPFSKNNTRGLSVQNSMTKALSEMGYISFDYKNTDLIQWTRDQNRMLESICTEEFGLEIHHPQAKQANIQHLEKEVYILQQKKKDRERQIHEIQQVKKAKIEEVYTLQREKKHVEQEVRALQTENIELKKRYNQIIDLYNSLVDKFNLLQAGCVEVAHEVIEHFRDRGIERER